jgi:hypothetical protein
VATVAHLPVVLLTVCTPDELPGWPTDAWVLPDCADHEPRPRTFGGSPGGGQVTCHYAVDLRSPITNHRRLAVFTGV